MFTFTLNNFLSGKMISIYLAVSAFCLLLALIILSGWDFPLCDKVYHSLQLAWFGGQIRKEKRKRKTGKKKSKTSTIENGDYHSNLFFLKKYGEWERYGSLSVNMEGKCKWNIMGGARASRGMPKATDWWLSSKE